MSATFAAPSRRSCLRLNCYFSSGGPFAGASRGGECDGWRVAHRWLGPGPLFPVELHSAIHLRRASCGRPLGILVGFASAGLSRLMYGFEDAFEHICGRLRVHWLWWPAIGGIGVGVGGFFFREALALVTTTSRKYCAVKLQ